MHATRTNMQVSIRSSLRETSFKSVKPICHIIMYICMELCFISVASMVCVSHVFVYNVVNENKIVISTSIKSFSFVYAKLCASDYIGLKPYLH